MCCGSSEEKHLTGPRRVSRDDKSEMLPRWDITPESMEDWENISQG